VSNVATKAQRPRKVLVADDDAFMQRIAAGLLHRAGHACDTVGDGSEAMHYLALNEVDLLLLDVSMPVLDGLATLARLRGLERHAAAVRRHRIIMVTAHAEPGDFDRLRAAGADGCIAKPIDPTAFLREVARVLALPA